MMGYYFDFYFGEIKNTHIFIQCMDRINHKNRGITSINSFNIFMIRLIIFLLMFFDANNSTNNL